MWRVIHLARIAQRGAALDAPPDVKARTKALLEAIGPIILCDAATRPLVAFDDDVTSAPAAPTP